MMPADLENLPLLLTPREAARELSIGVTKMYELIAQKQIPAVKVGGSTRVPTDALREWIRQQLETQED